MILRVSQYDEAILRQPGIAVETFDDDLRLLAENMLETMYAEEGIGLAAQQVGRAIRMFVMDTRAANPDGYMASVLDGRELPLDVIMPMTLVNPLVETFGEKLTWEEGCLSLPEIKGQVSRHESARISFQDLDGHPHVLESDGLLARCAQHEQDHLDGVLFIDPERMSASERKRLEPEIKVLREETRREHGEAIS